MDSSRRDWPSGSAGPEVVSAPTLKEAYRLVRSRYGEQAVILGSRNVTRRQERGLGHERLVEVMVQKPGTRAGAPDRRPAAGRPAGGDPDNLTADLLDQITRIEALVDEVTRQSSQLETPYADLAGNPLAETLLGAGASARTVDRLLTRFAGESGRDRSDRPGALAWLAEHLRASNCDWNGFYGCHAFLGESGCGRTDLVLTAAARLQQLGRKTLVLSVLPGHGGVIRRLQTEAAEHGYDAAIIQKVDQLAGSEAHLGRYEAVLLDLPGLEHPAMAEGSPLHTWLAGNPGFHRHLLVPLDRDLDDIEFPRRAARAWSCDWVAATRLDRTRRQGKLLDLIEAIPLPLSLLTADPAHGGSLEIAATGPILDRILAAWDQGAVGGAAGAARTELEFVGS